MSEQIPHKSRGISAAALRWIGCLCLALGAVGRAVIQNGMLGMGQNSTQTLLELLNRSPELMDAATVALVLQAIYSCAAPIFAFLLVEGFCHTGNYRNYLLRIAGAAVITELPYNLAMNGSWLAIGSRNPVFALVIGLVMLYFYRRYAQRSWSNFGVKAFVTAAAILWTQMLRIEDGAQLVILIAVVWALRNKPNFRTIGCCSAAIACTLISPYYALAPMACIILHFYNEEKGSSNKLVQYLTYPVILLAAGLAAILI